VRELADILAIEFKAGEFPRYHMNWRPDNPEEEVLSICSSLISIVDIDGSRVVQFSHFSVKEYLTSERLANSEKDLSRYHILHHSAHAILAKASLSVLLALDDQADKDSMKNFPLAMYAARYWVDHAQLLSVSSIIEDGLERLFDPEKPYFATWVWIHDIDYPFRETMIAPRPLPPEGTPLYYATLCGFRDLVEHLIVSHPWDINTRGGYHFTPLHAAVVKGDVEIVALLLEHGAAVAALNKDQFDPLYEASRRGCVDVVELLLDHHADVDSRTAFGRTSLSRASLHGELEIARVLLWHGAAVDSCDKYGWTPLMLAPRHGHADVVRFLLQNGAISETCDNGGWTPLMVASYHGQLDVIHLLLESGVTVDSRDNNGWTSLVLASKNGHVDVVSLLLEHGATVDSRGDNGWISLMIASRDGRLDVVRLLLENGATVDSRENNGQTSLVIASQNGHLDVVRLLLENGAAVAPHHKDGQIPSSGKLRYLLSSCAPVP
jgi:ankyrin repeat protein